MIFTTSKNGKYGEEKWALSDELLKKAVTYKNIKQRFEKEKL